MAKEASLMEAEIAHLGDNYFFSFPRKVRGILVDLFLNQIYQKESHHLQILREERRKIDRECSRMLRKIQAVSNPYESTDKEEFYIGTTSTLPAVEAFVNLITEGIYGKTKVFGMPAAEGKQKKEFHHFLSEHVTEMVDRTSPRRGAGTTEAIIPIQLRGRSWKICSSFSIEEPRIYGFVYLISPVEKKF